MRTRQPNVFLAARQVARGDSRSIERESDFVMVTASRPWVRGFMASLSAVVVLSSFPFAARVAVADSVWVQSYERTGQTQACVAQPGETPWQASWGPDSSWIPTWEQWANNGQGGWTCTRIIVWAKGLPASSPSDDPVVPADVPTGVTGVAGDGQVTVTWSAPASDGGSAITGYEVTGKPSGSCTTSGALSCTVSGLANGTAYSFTVTATNALGTSADSMPSGAVTPTATPTAPGEPTGVTGVAGDGQVTVTWSAPANDGGRPITGYEVVSSPGSLTCATGSTSCIVTGLMNDTTYTFTVSATNTAGTSSSSVASAPVTPKAAQAITFTNPGTQVFGTTPTLTATASSGLAVSFTSSTPALCSVSSSGDLTFVSSGTCTITANQAGDAGFLPASPVINSFTVSAVVPSSPTSVTGTSRDTAVLVSWTAPASNGGSAITGYQVQRSTSESGAYTDASGCTTTSTELTCMATGLTNGTTYFFKVAAINGAGTSDYSSASASVTPAIPTCTEPEGGAPVACAVGKIGPGGGTVFYVDLARAAGSQFWEVGSEGSATWGCRGQIITGTNTTIGTGATNTDRIKSGCITADIAARVASAPAGGYSDWFLPSKDELNQLCKYARTQSTAAADQTVTCNNTGTLRSGFDSVDYWSSSEFSEFNAEYQKFDTGRQQTSGSKSLSRLVRPIRAF